MVNVLKLFIAVAILLIVVGIFFLGKRLKYFFNFSSIKLRKSESFWILSIAAFLVLFTAVSEYFRFKPAASWLTLIGILIFGAGVILNFNIIKQKLKCNIKKCLKFGAEGIYVKLRYPGYTALLILMLGFIIIFSSFWAFVLFVVLLIPAVIFRVAQEDAALADIDEDSFELYISKTKKIIPRFF